MSFIELANQHQRQSSYNQRKYDRVPSDKKFNIPSNASGKINMNTMPFFESTLSKHYNPLVDKLKSKYENIHNPLKTSTPIDTQIWMPQPSPRSPPSNLNMQNTYQTSNHSTNQQVPLLKGILRNPTSSRRVSWSDMGPKPTAAPRASSVPVSPRNLTPQSLSMPITEVTATPKTMYTAYGSSGSTYNPVVMPSNKKTVKLGNSYTFLSNTADPDIIKQLGGIIKTIDSMQDTLRMHELRPIEYCSTNPEPFIAKQFHTAREIEHRIHSPSYQEGLAGSYPEDILSGYRSQLSSQGFENSQMRQGGSKMVS